MHGDTVGHRNNGKRHNQLARIQAQLQTSSIMRIRSWWSGITFFCVCPTDTRHAAASGFFPRRDGHSVIRSYSLPFLPLTGYGTVNHNWGLARMSISRYFGLAADFVVSPVSLNGKSFNKQIDLLPDQVVGCKMIPKSRSQSTKNTESTIITWRSDDEL